MCEYAKRGIKLFLFWGDLQPCKQTFIIGRVSLPLRPRKFVKNDFRLSERIKCKDAETSSA